MSGSDIIHGRRGGHNVDHDPTLWREDFAAIRAANGGELRTPAAIEGEDQGDQLDLFGGAA